jgi:alkanesulfonate monooxygenase SsuD/methylene tetrahydromethanopterin reductase-like flavin-dependent oxidoreductase (luciferase family)
MTLALLRQGRLIPVPPPEKALRFLAEQGQSADGAGPGRRGVIGSPATVRAGIEEVASRYGAEEVIVVTITWDHAARRRSYELIAEAFGLAGEPATVHAADRDG